MDEKSEIGSGFSPYPTSIVYPGLLKLDINQSLYPAYADSEGVKSREYPLESDNIFPISYEFSGFRFPYFQ